MTDKNFIIISSGCFGICGVVAQLVRAPPCHGGGCEFESRRPRHENKTSFEALLHRISAFFIYFLIPCIAKGIICFINTLMDKVSIEKNVGDKELDKVLAFINREGKEGSLKAHERKSALQSIESLNMSEIMKAITSLLVWNSVSSIVSLGVNTGMAGFVLAQGSLKLKYLLPSAALWAVDFIGKYLFLQYRFKHLISKTSALKAATPYFGMVFLVQDLLKNHPDLRKALTLYLTTGVRQRVRQVTDFFRPPPQPVYGALYARAS